MPTANSQDDTPFRVLQRRWEIVGESSLREKFLSGQLVKGYWGTAPTGKPHIGYLVPLIKIAECVSAGIEIIILIADSYGFLINHDVSLETVEYRARYYELLLMSVLSALNVPADKILVMRESEYSMTENFSKDTMCMCAVSSLNDLKEVSQEIGQTDVLGPLLCPISQALSEVYTRCDFQLGGLDQYGAFAYADRYLPQIGYTPVAHIASDLIPGLTSGKMSSSSPATSKIMFTDSSELVRAKIDRADITGLATERNALMACLKHIVFPMRDMGTIDTQGAIMSLFRGGLQGYENFEGLERDFERGLTDVQNLRSVLAGALNYILGRVQIDYAGNQEWQAADYMAYGSG